MRAYAVHGRAFTAAYSAAAKGGHLPALQWLKASGGDHDLHMGATYGILARSGFTDLMARVFWRRVVGT